MNNTPDGERTTLEQIQKTEAWLEDGMRKARQNPSLEWLISIRAGEKVLAQQRTEYEASLNDREEEQRNGSSS